MTETQPTLFERIIARDIPADILYEDEQCIVIRDIAPKAPTHLLIIPRKPIPRLVDAQSGDKALLGHLMWVAGEIARRAGVAESFRLIVNNGAGSGQTVFHLHLHLLGNKAFTEGNLGF